MNSQMIRISLAELLGTFTLVFVGCAAVTVAGETGGLPVAALAHGLVLVGLIYTYGHISGAHFNPAVTAGLLVGGKITLVSAAYYWVAQFAGGILGALVLSIILGSNANLGPTTGTLTTSSVWSAALFEAIMTFFLVSAVYQTAAFSRAGINAAIAIGFTLAGSIFAGGAYTGASLNPARTLGPALVMGDLSYLIPYLIGIFAGGIIAGLVHTYVLSNKD